MIFQGLLRLSTPSKRANEMTAMGKQPTGGKGAWRMHWSPVLEKLHIGTHVQFLVALDEIRWPATLPVQNSHIFGIIHLQSR